ncbi:hypothetical protein CEXT_798001 [Caerostris extrusa]|uniref:Uncharacterized protein n=1 Tax=Caerostris extrusa TaxID=172846 RepID=A0AAV4V6L2_CAEEX|nr:hypothetical protein CEXT_798001 [Caerostris extrusa]
MRLKLSTTAKGVRSATAWFDCRRPSKRPFGAWAPHTPAFRGIESQNHGSYDSNGDKVFPVPFWKKKKKKRKGPICCKSFPGIIEGLIVIWREKLLLCASGTAEKTRAFSDNAKKRDQPLDKEQ